MQRKLEESIKDDFSDNGAREKKVVSDPSLPEQDGDYLTSTQKRVCGTLYGAFAMTPFSPIDGAPLLQYRKDNVAYHLENLYYKGVVDKNVISGRVYYWFVVTPEQKPEWFSTPEENDAAEMGIDALPMEAVTGEQTEAQAEEVPWQSQEPIRGGLSQDENYSKSAKPAKYIILRRVGWPLLRCNWQ